jgi:pentatricopeptide repeat protein
MAHSFVVVGSGGHLSEMFAKMAAFGALGLHMGRPYLSPVRYCSLESSPETIETMLKACKYRSDYGGALKVLDDMDQQGIQPTLSVANLAITVDPKNWQLALKMLKRMLKAGVERDTQLYNSALSVCGEGGRYFEALQLFDEMEHLGLERNIRTYTHLIESLFNPSNHISDETEYKEDALKLLKKMQDEGVPRDVFVYEAISNTFHVGAHWQKVLALLQTTDNEHVHPSSRALQLALVVCANGQQVDAALSLVEELQLKGQCNTHIFNAVFSTVVHQRKWKEMEVLLSHLGKEGIQPDEYTLKLAILAGQTGGRIV